MSIRALLSVRDHTGGMRYDFPSQTRLCREEVVAQWGGGWGGIDAWGGWMAGGLLVVDWGSVCLHACVRACLYLFVRALVI